MKIKSASKQFALALLLLTIFSCEDTTIVKNYTGTGEEKTYSIEGYAQKGPFIVGTDVTVSELSEDLYPTGRVFFATILNDEGYFELPGVVLTSPYIQIKVRGRYFSETGGYVPTEELTLYSLADITKSETINVNILTHLEKERVEYLVQNEDFSFETAKEKAQNEILEIFEWENISIDNSEQLNISENNSGGEVLLAMSSVFEAIEFVARLETITNFKIDFAQDGTLETESIKNRLLTAAALLNQPTIRQNMESKYEVEIPDFESTLQLFIDNSTFVNYFDIIFPETYNGYVNLFRTEDKSINSSFNYAFIIAPFPETINIAKVSSSIVFNATFFAKINFPTDAINNFIVEPNELFNLEYYLRQNYTCDSDIECHEVFASGGLVSVPNNSMIQLPITYTGHGNLRVFIALDIDEIFYSYDSGDTTW